MRCLTIVGLGVLSMYLCASAAHSQPVSSKAAAVIQSIDALDVERHWPAGVHVFWETGVPDGRSETGPGKHTHCIAFVAAAAKNLGIYILRPPDHSQILLANAQYDWLGTDGAREGWEPIGDGVAAQEHANRGDLVVVTYKSHHDDKPGHIAIVRPSDKPTTAVRHEGPQVTQAGGTNYRSISLRIGFAGHPAAWAKKEVRYFAHAVADNAGSTSKLPPKNVRNGG